MQASHVNFKQIAGTTTLANLAVEHTLRSDAEISTPCNKALDTLGKTPINVYILSAYLEHYKPKSFIIYEWFSKRFSFAVLWPQAIPGSK